MSWGHVGDVTRAVLFVRAGGASDARNVSFNDTPNRFLPVNICDNCEVRDVCRVPTKSKRGHCYARKVLSSNVRSARHEAGWTQEELAREAGIDRSYLARLEAEAVNISVNVLFAISKSLDINPCELLREPEIK